MIESGAKLNELDLSDNAFGPDGVKAIKKLLTSPVCYSLQVLKLNNNGLGIGGGKVEIFPFLPPPPPEVSFISIRLPLLQ